MKAGDLIFFDYKGDFCVDKIKEIIEVDGQNLITPFYWDLITITNNELLDETDRRVKEYNSLRKDKTINLSDARNWLNNHAYQYYEPDEWSSFDSEQLVKDFCIAMLG